MQKKLTKKTSTNRISVTDSDVEPLRLMPTIAGPAAFGHGPTVSMPTLMGLAQEGAEFQVDASHDFDVTMMTSRDSSEEPVSPVSPPIAPIGRATVEGRDTPTTQDQPVVLRRQASALKKSSGNRNVSINDLAYKFMQYCKYKY